MAKDYYKILEVEKDTSKEDIKKAYRRLAHRYHPDKEGGDEQKFKDINEAYQVLSDDTKRAQYNQFGQTFDGSGAGGFGGSSGQQGFSGDWDLGDVFEQFFGGRSRAGTKTAQRGEDIYIDEILTLEDALAGVQKDAQIKKFVQCSVCEGTKKEPGSSMDTCKTCQGKGEVHKMQRTFLGSFAQIQACPECRGEGEIPQKRCKHCSGTGRMQDVSTVKIQIPAGIDEGEMIRITGGGEMGLGGAAGDLYVRVHIKEHPIFRREQDTIHSTVTIPLSLAVLGGKKEVQTIDGTVNLEIPAGIQSGTILKLKGKGMPHPHSWGRGDHLVHIRIETPKKLSKRAKELFEQMREEGI